MPHVKRKINRKIPYKAIVLALLFLLAFSGVLAYLSTTLLAGEKIYKGVTVCGISVGGLTKDEALATLDNAAKKSLGDMNIDLVHREKKRALDITDRVTIDSAAAVEEAYNAGRGKNTAQRLAIMFGQKVDLPISVTYDEKYIKSKIEAFAEEAEKEHSVFKISNDKKTVDIDLSGSGIIVDVNATFNQFANNGYKLKFEDLSMVTQTKFDESTVDLLYSRIRREPINATCKIINNKPVIETHQSGIDVDRAEIANNIKQGKKVFIINATEILPKVTSDSLEASMFKDVLGEFTTRYDASKTGRSKNMALAASKINGIVIPSGENFSFNKIVGERTYAKGYQDANVYVGGRVEQGVGGGICQVASTLYSAELYADLQTVVRHNHQFTVSYLPLGQDATVSWNSIDLVFKNNTEYPIKILATVSGGVHNIKIMGTKEDKSSRIKLETVTISSKEPAEKVTVSDDLAPGKTVITQKGQSGAVVDTYKVYLKNGVEEKRVLLHRSTYAAMDKLISKSSKAAPSKQTENTIEEVTETTEDPSDTSAAPSSAKPEPSPQQTVPSEQLSDNGI